MRKKGNTLKYWYDYVAVFSGSNIYFYPVEHSDLIQEVSKYYKKQAEIEGLQISQKIDDHTKVIAKKKSFNFARQSIEHLLYFPFV